MKRVRSDIKLAAEKARDKALVKLITCADLIYDERFDLFKLVIKLRNCRRPYIIPIKYKHDRPN